jgi:hypothetical protein
MNLILIFQISPDNQRTLLHEFSPQFDLSYPRTNVIVERTGIGNIEFLDLEFFIVKVFKVLGVVHHVVDLVHFCKDHSLDILIPLNRVL